MTDLKLSLDYDQFQELLDEAEAAVSMAEVHGLQTGMICAQLNVDAKLCRQQLLTEMECQKAVTASLEKSIDELFNLTTSKLKDLEFSFSPFLPEDNNDILQSSRLLCDWCRGFLCGLALSGIRENSLKQEDAKEAFQDLSQIAYAEIDAEQDNEDEKHYFELLEYVRVVVQTIHIELRSNLTTDQGQNSDTVH